jgi:hypothetical protein
LGLSPTYVYLNGGTIVGAQPLTGSNAITLSTTSVLRSATFIGSNSIEFNANFGAVNDPSTVTNKLASGATLQFDGSLSLMNNTGLVITGTGTTNLAGGVTAGTSSTELAFDSTGTTILGGTSAIPAESLGYGYFYFKAGTNILTGTIGGMKNTVENAGTVFNETSTGVIANSPTNGTATYQAPFNVTAGSVVLAGNNTFSGSIS